MNQQYEPAEQPFQSSTHSMTAAQASVDARLNFIRKTYLLFMAGILAAIVGGIVSLNTPLAYMVASAAPWSFLAILPLSMAAGVMAGSRNESIAYLGLFGFTLITGIIFAPILVIYAPAVVGQAAFLTAVIFASLTAYVFVTRKDFSFLGGMLFVGILGIIIAGLANVFFFKSAGMGYWLAWVMAFVSSGFILYDTSNIIQRYPLHAHASAALALFVNFFNLFLSILRILGGNRN